MIVRGLGVADAVIGTMPILPPSACASGQIYVPPGKLTPTGACVDNQLQAVGILPFSIGPVAPLFSLPTSLYVIGAALGVLLVARMLR